MGLMYVFSIITVIEIVYFCTGKFFTFSWNDWRENMHRKISTRSATKRNIKADDKEPPPTYSLYWNELVPKHRYNMQYFRYHPRSTQD